VLNCRSEITNKLKRESSLFIMSSVYKLTVYVKQSSHKLTYQCEFLHPKWTYTHVYTDKRLKIPCDILIPRLEPQTFAQGRGLSTVMNIRPERRCYFISTGISRPEIPSWRATLRWVESACREPEPPSPPDRSNTAFFCFPSFPRRFSR